MSEIYVRRKLLHAVPGANPGQFDRVSRLREDTSPLEVPDGFYRGDVTPAGAPPWSRFYRSTLTGGSGNGVFYRRDPGRERWLSERLVCAEFGHEAVSGSIPTFASGGFALKMFGGMTVSSTWGIPLLADSVMVAIDFQSDIAVDGSPLLFAVGLDGALVSGPASVGGSINVGTAAGRGEAPQKNIAYELSDGVHLTGYLGIASGSTNVTGGGRFYGRAWFRRWIPDPA